MVRGGKNVGRVRFQYFARDLGGLPTAKIVNLLAAQPSGKEAVYSHIQFRGENPECPKTVSPSRRVGIVALPRWLDDQVSVAASQRLPVGPIGKRMRGGGIPSCLDEVVETPGIRHLNQQRTRQCERCPASAEGRESERYDAGKDKVVRRPEEASRGAEGAQRLKNGYGTEMS